MEEITFEELKEATKKAVELLQKKGHPNLQIVVSQNCVQIIEEQMGILIPFSD